MFLYPLFLSRHRFTHLERNGEHQNSEDESPKGPVPKHLQKEDKKKKVNGHIKSHNSPHGSVLQCIYEHKKGADRHLHFISAMMICLERGILFLLRFGASKPTIFSLHFSASTFLPAEILESFKQTSGMNRWNESWEWRREVGGGRGRSR